MTQSPNWNTTTFYICLILDIFRNHLTFPLTILIYLLNDIPCDVALVLRYFTLFGRALTLIVDSDSNDSVPVTMPLI